VNREKSLRALCVVALSAFVCLEGASGTSLLEVPKLTSLRGDCKLELRSGRKPRPMLWLACKSCSFVLLGRASLEGHVRIQTPEQALEFVRLFSTPNTWYLSRLERMVEVTAGKRPDRFRFVVSERQFSECCIPPAATLAASSSSGVKWFEVRRTVVEEDYQVFAITEVVDSDGNYTITDKSPLSIPGKELGAFLNPYDI
jgi:hypothetical protein